MKAPYKWLKEYCSFDAEPQDYAHRVTMSGSKVEGYANAADSIKNVVSCKITAIEKHPDADKLQVCSIDAGYPLQIVTAATNVFVGAVVPVALDGSLLATGQKIKSGKLRGVESQGMFCSIAELGLTVHDFPDCIEDGIMILPSDTPVGKDITEVLMLDDTVFEYEITSNRVDCLCVSGLARETAATYGVPFEMHSPMNRPLDGDANRLLKVTNAAPDLCLRYTAALVKNVHIAPSPLWMRTRLRQCGVRPINNIVDITNYVMLEYNQPMHAFDLEHVAGDEIIVRRAVKGEKITTLDEVERTLTPEMLVIADAEKPAAVAGVMGGMNSGVYDTTNTIVFESACFEPKNNRATSVALSLKSDSSYRFEKGLDPNNTYPALMRALELVEQLGVGEVVSGIIDIKGDINKPATLPLEMDKINAFLGTEIPLADMKKYLSAVGFTVNPDCTVTAPTFRVDIESYADIAEEVARFYGYDKIPNTVMSGSAAARPTERQRFRRTVADACIASGLDEIQTSSFLNPRAFTLLNIGEDSELRNAVRIRNPFGEETSLMRTTAVSSMMDVLATNFKARVEGVAFYETATEYTAASDINELPTETEKLIIGSYGKLDFYALKGVIEHIFDAVSVKKADYRATVRPFYHPGRTAEIYVKGETVGVLGEIHPEISENYGIRDRVVVAELDMAKLMASSSGVKHYMGLPRFPALQRDLAFVCDEETPSAVIEGIIKKHCGNLLEKVTVFDVYRGEQLPSGKKSIAYKLTLRAPDRTLTDNEADEAVSRVLAAAEKLDIRLRA